MSVKLYDTFVVRNIVCDNVKVSELKDDVFIATFGFSERCGLYGDLLQDIKRDCRISSCIIDVSCSNIHCEPRPVQGNSAARGPSSSNGRAADQTVRDLCQSYPIFTAVVDVEFKNVSGRLNESVDGNINTVLYDSFKVISMSKLRSWNYNPAKRYGSLGVGQVDVGKITEFESIRDNM